MTHLDETEAFIAKRLRPVSDLPLFTPEEGEASSRLSAALASAEGSATPNETHLVEQIQKMLCKRHKFSGDTIADLLDAAGVVSEGPGALGVRRRYVSRIVNGKRGQWWKPGEKILTTRKGRSGRWLTEWTVIHPNPHDESWEAL